MTPKETILYSLLPQAEGLLEVTVLGLRNHESFNKEGAATTLKEVIGMLEKIRSLIEKE